MTSPSPDPENRLIDSAAGWALLAMLFLTGFLLMGFEMLGSRYLNPWFGGGITTWASLISVVLLAMMAGYMSGGYLADRSLGLAPMAAAIGLSGLYMLAVALLADPAIELILDALGDGFAGVLTSSFLLCFVPVACLAGLSPYVVKLLLHRISQGGRITGLVYAVSTAGNIAGTLLTVFWLIPMIGTRTITTIFGWSLILLALLLILQSRRASFAAVALAVIWPLVPADNGAARAETVSYEASYPEGPLWVGETLFFAEMTADRIAQTSGRMTQTFWKREGCGPTAITALGGTGFAINCHLEGIVALVSRDGSTLETIAESGGDKALRNPNDINSQGGGPVFFSDPGPFLVEAGAQGRVYRLNGKNAAVLVADRFHYANGVAFDAGQRKLYVSEHLARRVWEMDLDENLLPRGRRVVLDGADLLGPEPTSDPYTGPDGLRLDADGSLFVAIYGAGLVVHRKTDGTLHHVRVPMKYVTSIALSSDRIAITGADDNRVFPYRGRVLVIDRGTFAASDRVGF